MSAAAKQSENYRDSIATVDEGGKRIWMYPKKPKGYFTNLRTYVSWVLLAILFGLPFIKVNGDPLVLLNVLERRFIIFGIHFLPQDFHLFVLAMLTFMVFIVLFTVIYGRLFCGWVCPQTIFMEMVFRKIEYWLEGDANAQRRLAKAPWTWNKLWRKGLKQIIFVGISVLIAHTFLSYILGIDRVTEIVTSPPSENWAGFFGMIAFTGAFYFVFSWLREQVCIAICPYGRLQGVFVDQNTIAVMYDYVRGEPRGKMQKKRAPKKVVEAKDDCKKTCDNCAAGNPCDADKLEAKPTASATLGVSPTSLVATLQGQEEPVAVAEPKLGDCIDCKLCVQVCPTGIDIRDGIQLECVNCTACIDACDEVMDKIGRDRGLIRYDSESGISSSTRKIFTGRVKAYTAVLALLILANVFLFSTRTSVEAIILRTPGMLYQKVDENTLSNLYNFQVINKTSKDMPIEFVSLTEGATIRPVGTIPSATPDKMSEGAFFIDMDKAFLGSQKTKVKIAVISDGKEIDRVNTNFLGPVK